MLLTDAQQVKAVCARMAAQDYVTVDTEFLRETTFWPRLCLVQIASADDAVAIDALAEGMDLTPLYDLMRNPSVLKVFHAARQDLEIFWKAMGVLPAPVFDTQVAAMVLGHGDQVGYEALVQRIVGVPLDKTSRVTDWTRRPLSDAQCAYAIADVTHLRPIYERLSQDLKKRGRAEWMKEEMATLTSVATYAQEPARAWERYAGRVRKPRDLAVLMRLSAWREAEAQARDVPRSRVVKDDTMFDIAMSAPKTAEALGNIRSVPKGWERSRDGLKIVDLVNEALAIDPKSLPPVERHRPPSHAQSATVELLKVLLKMIAEKHHVSAKIIATSDDLDRIAEQDDADIGALKGWRRDLFGDKALALKAGKLALALEKGRVILVERPVDETVLR